MNETVIYLDDGWIFVRHEGLYEDRSVILFIHGLGESGLCFNEAFDSPELKKYALIVPDLLGYGRSSFAYDGDYNRVSQTRRLWKLLDNLGIGSFSVIGHSMGGDLATFMASSDSAGRIKGLVNIEGNLTPHDIFFSNKVVSAAERGDFPRWFSLDFNEELVLKKWGNLWASCRRYYASLQFCRPEAFLANAMEIFQKNQPLPGRKECLTGITYAGLKIPKVFCWGSESLAEGTLEFLESASLKHRKFEPAFHWPMIDQSQEFYAFVSGFLGSIP
jgi:pimeloyl-ACP methyl ester carboxylesterase